MDLRAIRQLEDDDQLTIVTDCGAIYGLSSLPYEHHAQSTVSVCAGYSVKHGKDVVYHDADNAMITKILPVGPRSYVESFERFSEGFQRSLNNVQGREEKSITIITSKALLDEYFRAKGVLPADCVVFEFRHIGDIVERVRFLRGVYRHRFVNRVLASLTEQAETGEESE